MKGHGVQTPELCGDLLEIRVELKSAFFPPPFFFLSNILVHAPQQPAVWGPGGAQCGGPCGAQCGHPVGACFLGLSMLRVSK